MTHNNYQTYNNPLNTRYSSTNMQYIWSEKNKFTTWRQMWYSLAESQHELDLKSSSNTSLITKQQLEQLKSHINITDEEIAKAKQHEKEVRHDVMSHVKTYAESCPLAAPIIHLGATSCFVGDNTDLCNIKRSLYLTSYRLLNVIKELSQFASTHKDIACVGYTHFQTAQLTTVGKRAMLWVQDMMFDYQDLSDCIKSLPFRSTKGTTGSQASYVELFNNDGHKVKQLESLVAKKMSFNKVLSLSGQTYTRKIDSKVLSICSRIAETFHKFATDIRLLMHLKEIEEPFGSKQIGSSAMAYKRNPMRSERICSLSRFVMSLVSNGQHTHANQWLERTLDDSANRRLSLPQAFLGVDAILLIAQNISQGLVVHKEIIRRNVERELPFQMTEEIIMKAVNNAGDRQQAHEVIRSLSMQVSEEMSLGGTENKLLDKLKDDDYMSKYIDIDKIRQDVDVMKYTGMCSEQVDEYDIEVKYVLNQMNDVKKELYNCGVLDKMSDKYELNV